MDESRCYRTIKEILANSGGVPKARSIIRSKIVEAFGENGYLSAVTSYLWQAYRVGDEEAKSAFLKLFHQDLKNHDPAAFYFFSLHYQHNLRRVAFDRRSGQDRRNAYSVDFFENRLMERRLGAERRKNEETRLNWTRVDDWVSVPFKSSPTCRGATHKTATPPPAEQLLQFLPPLEPSGAAPEKEELSYHFLNSILTLLVNCFHNLNLAENPAGAKALDRQIFQEAAKVMFRLTEIAAKQGEDK